MERCFGTLSRRELIRTGLVGLSSLGLADLLRTEGRAASNPTRGCKSIIMLWLWGGPSHMETFDLKPDAPTEYRGEFRPIHTKVPGLDISEHLPLLAQQADKFALIRSLHHNSPGHVSSTHTMLTGYPGTTVESPPFRPDYPDVRAVINKVLGPRSRDVPSHIAMPYTKYFGPAYLGTNLDPMLIAADPASPDFKAPSLSLESGSRPRFSERRSTSAS